eukprot:TRINITY_DN1766_c0_g1_i14.p1 TRINITY_DN1766_c0_g1~~TRINITY_DN1766_c0_g1_i14.p1  ORF type:complete len:230 (-),score=31.94 TRINITY_DN1766_c0_g1_i14:291-980(-)
MILIVLVIGFLFHMTPQETTLLLQAIFSISVLCCAIVNQELRLLQSRGYLKLYEKTSLLIWFQPLVLSFGNSVLLILWTMDSSPFQTAKQGRPFFEGYSIQPSTLALIIVMVELALICLGLLLFSVHMWTHFSRRKPPDVTRKVNRSDSLIDSSLKFKTSIPKGIENMSSYINAQETRIKHLTTEILALKKNLKTNTAAGVKEEETENPETFNNSAMTGEGTTGEEKDF